MNLIEVCIDTFLNNGRTYHYGEILFDCGLSIKGICFHIHNNVVHVNYPAVLDKKHIFHPSFQIKDIYADRAVKGILEYAWNLMENTEKMSVYGRRKVNCHKKLNELSEDDFEWFNEKKDCEYSFCGINEYEIRVKLVDNRKSANIFRFAYASVYFDECFVISNLKISENSEGIGTIQFPLYIKGEAVAFMSKDDRSWIEDYIVKEFLNRTKQTKKAVKTEELTDDEQLFRILWSSSENGYILQSKIRIILEQNQIDWKNIYHVNRISELVEKISFMSPRRLETSPEHYVDWVAITCEKDPEPVIVENENTPILYDDVKEELHNVLMDEYIRNGKIDLSCVIPYLSEKHPDVFKKLPNVKLKKILQSCNFISFEGGPMPPIYIHVQVSNTSYLQKENSDSFGDNDNVQPFVKFYEQFDLTGSVEQSKKKTEEYDYLAKNNPFSFVPNTKLIQEQNIPDTKLPKIITNEAMRRFQSMASLGQLDSMDLEIVYWVSKLQYSKSTMLYDLITGGLIEIPAGKSINRDKLSTRLMRLYKVNLIGFYKLCSVDENGDIISKSAHRILMVTSYGRTQLRMIGRQSDFDFFLALDNIEKILNKLSINQWFTKFIAIFKDAFYYFNVIVTAKIAEANAARIPLIAVRDGIPVFVTACKRGSLFDHDIRSGEFAFWIKRVSNLIENYNKLYIGDQLVEFKKKPKWIFICEDLEHCIEVFRHILKITSTLDNSHLLNDLWFADDLNVYNDFLHVHYSFDNNERRIPENIDNFLNVEIRKKSGEDAEFINEQDLEEDIRILKELEREERIMMPFLDEDVQ